MRYAQRVSARGGVPPRDAPKPELLSFDTKGNTDEALLLRAAFKWMRVTHALRVQRPASVAA